MRKINLPEDLLRELYVEQGLTTYQIAEELGVNRQTISNKLKEYNIELRDSRFKPVKKKLKRVKKYPYKDKATYERKYKELKSIDLVAEFFNINVKTAFDWKKRHGIDTIKNMSYKGIEKRMEGKPWADKDNLETMYNQYSSTELAKMWNCDPSTIQKWVKRHGIEVKDHSEQWARKSKSGILVVKEDQFDMKAYREQIQLGVNLSKRTLQYIKDIVGSCQSCGYDQTLDLHHIDEDRANNEPDNHVILCPNCHALIHRLGKTVEELCPDYESWADILESYSEAK